MKHPFHAIAAIFAIGLSPLSAKDDVPRGFMPISELAEAREKAKGKQLIVLVVKGLDDDCPNCATTLENGEKAVGSGVVKVFARAETLNKEDTGSYPAALKERADKKFTTGAAVTFLVFDPAMEKIIAEASRRELQDNKKLTAEFKKSVQEAKRGYK
jgi:hypothetical protein